MNILAVGKGFLQCLHIGDMRGQPELDLAIVGGKNDVAGRGDKGLSYLPADLGTDRNILQIGFGRGQPPGLCSAQTIGGMNPSGFRIDLLLQRIGVSGFQLRQLPPVDDFLRNRLTIAGQPLEHGYIGRILPRFSLLTTFQTKLAEQDFTQLLGTADRKRFTGQLVDLCFQLFHFLGKCLRQPRQFLAVNQHAGGFHSGNHRDQRPVNHLVDAGRPFRDHPQAQDFPQPQRDIGVLRAIFGRFVERHFGKADRLLAGAGDRFEADALMTEMQLGQFIHTVPVQAGIEIETHHQGVVKRGDPDIMLRQHAHVIFQILPDLEHRIIFEQRFQPGQRFVQTNLVRCLAEHIAAAMTERNIASLVGSSGQTDADDPRGHAFKTVGLQINRADALFRSTRDPLIERRDCLYAFIF